MKLLVTHRAPDLDAITSVWVLRRFDAQSYADAKLYFVNAGEAIDPRVAADMGFNLEDITHTDTGLGDFDHHQPERGMKRMCATSLVTQYVCHIHPELQQDRALAYIAEYATIIDHFEEQAWDNAADLKYQFMVHNLIDGIRRSGVQDDQAVMNFGFQCLDAVYAGLAEQIQAQEIIETKKNEFDTKWGKGIALETANDEVIKLSQKRGYAIAIRKDPHKGDIRIKAVPGKGIDLTPIADKIMKMDAVGRWYFHPGKTMLLNGSSKELSRKPSPLTIQQVIEVFQKI